MLAIDGTATAEDLQAVLPTPDRRRRGAVAVIECFQEIPCNPCADACPRGAITMPENISQRPVFDPDKCNGCGVCVGRCPGLAIFVVDYSYGEDTALLKIPYEFRPLPQAGDSVTALDRQGAAVGSARVVKVQEQKNRTTILWLAVTAAMATAVRNIRLSGEVRA